MKEEQKQCSPVSVEDRAKQAKGRLKIVAVRKDHPQDRKEIVNTQNICVQNFYGQLCRLLGNDVAGRYISFIQFGTGADPEAITDVALAVPIVPQLPVVVSYPEAMHVRFAATLGADEAVGFNIAEAGLFFETTGLAARTAFGPVAKLNGWIWYATWEISWGPY